MSSAAVSNELSLPVQRSLAPWYGARLALSDAVFCTFAAALSLRLFRPFNPGLTDFRFVALTIACVAAVGGYRRRFANSRMDFFATLIGTALAFVVGGILTRSGAPLTAQLIFSAVATLLCLLFVRLAHLVIFRHGSARRPLPMVILGTSESARIVYRAFEEGQGNRKNEDVGLSISAICLNAAAEPWLDAKTPVFVKRGELKSIAACNRIEHGIVAVPTECNAETEELFGEAARIFKYLFVAPQIVASEMTLATHPTAGEELVLHVGHSLAPVNAEHLKRLLDVVATLALSLLSLPLVVLAALAIRFGSTGPLLYRQIRIGKGNRAFTALKFRTMYINADERLNEYLASDPALRKEWESVHKLRDDPRVTPVGRLLRRFSLDELPQLWNVMAGDMSLVGPRPIVISEIARYGRFYAAYERVRPGLTGLWQVSGRNNTTYKERVGYDSYYVQNRSLKLDAYILARTLRAVVSGAGAY